MSVYISPDLHLFSVAMANCERCFGTGIRIDTARTDQSVTVSVMFCDCVGVEGKKE